MIGASVSMALALRGVSFGTVVGFLIFLTIAIIVGDYRNTHDNFLTRFLTWIENHYVYIVIFVAVLAFVVLGLLDFIGRK